MTDIFTEVDESVRQAKLATWWSRWRPFIFVGVAALIGAVALNEFVLKPGAERSATARALELETAVKALEEGEYDTARTAFEAIAAAGTELSPIASHFLAQVQFEGGGDVAGAAATLAATGAVDGGPFERIAVLKSAYLTADTISLAELEARLGTLASDDSALGALSRELIAAKAYQAGDVARARTLFNQLKFDAAAPAGVIERADIALAAMPLTATETQAPPAELPAPTQTEEPGQ